MTRPKGETDPKKSERRKEMRMRLNLPVRVQGYDPDGASWAEMTTSEDVSYGGIAFRLKRHVLPGQALLLSLPLPKTFRRYDLTDPSYRVYGLVRTVTPGQGSSRVGLFFLGKDPPRDFAEVGGKSRYLLPKDEAPGTQERRQFPRVEVFVTLKLRRLDGSGQEEHTVTENLSKGGARVLTAMTVAKGEILMVEEPGGTFRTRAEIVSLFIGKDHVPRLGLRFIDAEAPDRLISG